MVARCESDHGLGWILVMFAAVMPAVVVWRMWQLPGWMWQALVYRSQPRLVRLAVKRMNGRGLFDLT